MTDSLDHHKERSTKMREEYEAAAQKAAQAEAQRKQQQEERDRVTRHAQADELEARMGIIREDESREMLLERIRKMREDVPVDPVYEGYRSPEQKAAFEAEQKAGREAVARAEADAERSRIAREKAGEENTSVAVTVPVHHPNPSQDEQYPAVKATLGKPNERTKIR